MHFKHDSNNTFYDRGTRLRVRLEAGRIIPRYMNIGHLQAFDALWRPWQSTHTHGDDAAHFIVTREGKPSEGEGGITRVPPL